MNRTGGRDQKDYISFRESDSYDRPNRYGERDIRPDSYRTRDNGFEEENGMKRRWSNDVRSTSFHENHSGKGPRGYARSEARIRDEACEILAHDHELDATDIEVDYKDHCIILRGHVDRRYDKKLAERLVEYIPGVEDVQNLLQIR